MKTEIEWAELHAPLFLAGTNLGQKLDPKKRSGVVMAYDEVKRHLFVTYNGQTARIPETSVLSMVEYSTLVEAPKLAVNAAPPVKPAGFDPYAAQVETPMSHVHAGLGHGQTGQELPKNKGGRPPKAEKAII